MRTGCLVALQLQPCQVARKMSSRERLQFLQWNIEGREIDLLPECVIAGNSSPMAADPV